MQIALRIINIEIVMLKRAHVATVAYIQIAKLQIMAQKQKTDLTKLLWKKTSWVFWMSRWMALWQVEKLPYKLRQLAVT